MKRCLFLSTCLLLAVSISAGATAAAVALQGFWYEQKKITASDAADYDYYGRSVDVDGDTVVVGALGAQLGSTTDNGAVYVHYRDQGGAGQWGQVEKVQVVLGERAYLGCAVAIDGDTLVVGADQAGPFEEGRAVIFYRNQGGTDEWGVVQTLEPVKDSEYDVWNDSFGQAVAIDGDTVVVGAPTDFAYRAGSNIRFQGSVYVFQRDEGGADNWGQVKKLWASDGTTDDKLGSSVGVSGDAIVAGAPGDDSDQGSAYVFERDEGGAENWGQVKKLTASDGAAPDWFGVSAGIHADTVVVGAHQDNSSRGAAYIFERDEGGAENWGEVKKLTASDAAPQDVFGYAVAIYADRALIGAIGDESDRGAAYVFERNEGGLNQWGEAQKLVASDGVSLDYLGMSVAIDADTAIAGADTGNFDRGAAYVWEWCDAPPPATPSGPSPANGATAVDVESDLNWADASNATSYDVYFGTSSTPPYYDSTTSSSYALPTLSFSTHYYWQIVASNACDSAAGPVWDFVTCSVPLPGTPVLLAPANGASTCNQPTFTWQAVTAATGYRIEVERLVGGNWLPLLAADTAQTSYTPSPLSGGLVHRWRVRAFNDCGNSPYSGFWTFLPVSVPLPGAPGLPSPADQATGVALDADLDWADAANAYFYSVYFGTSSPPPYYLDTGVSSQALPPLNPSTTYHWKVVAHNLACSTEGPEWQFTTCDVPAAPGSPLPADGAVGVGLHSDLDWADAAGAMTYTVYFGTSPSPPPYTTTVSSELALPRLAESTQYFWKVVAENDCGTTAGPEWDLTTGVNSTPTLGTIAPSSGNGPVETTTYFTTTWQDADGWSDLKQCYFHIGADATVVGNVTLLYNAVKNRLWMLYDDASGWTGGCAPGSAGTMENSQAIVHCDLTAVQGSGDTLGVTWAIEFKSGYTGDKKTGLKCKDVQKARAKAKWKGTWTIE